MIKQNQPIHIRDEFIKLKLRLEGHLNTIQTNLRITETSLKNVSDKIILSSLPKVHSSYKVDKSQVINRIRRNSVTEMLCLCEQHLKAGLDLLTTILNLDGLSVPTKEFNQKYNDSSEYEITMGKLSRNIKKAIKEIDPNIIPSSCKKYGYLNHYSRLRNCLIHRGGWVVSQKDTKMEIKFPKIEIDEVNIRLSTTTKKWKLNDYVEFDSLESDGIASGISQTASEILEHMWKAADKYIEKIEQTK